MGIGMVFQQVENELWDTFLPAFFQEATFQIPGRAIDGLTVNSAGITLHYPTQNAGANRTVSCVATGKIVAVLCGTA